VQSNANQQRHGEIGMRQPELRVEGDRPLEQLAGDELPDASAETMIATGFPLRVMVISSSSDDTSSTS